MTSEGGRGPEVGDAAADVLGAAYYYSLVDGHRAVEPAIAEQRGHRDIGTSHLLAAVLEEADSSAVRLLVDVGASGDPLS